MTPWQDTLRDIFERPFDGDEDPRIRVAQCITRAEAEAILEHRGDMIAALSPLPDAPVEGEKASRTDLSAHASASEAATDRLSELERENETLRLAICGGEDAPGYAASLSLEAILGVLRDNYASRQRDAELARGGRHAGKFDPDEVRPCKRCNGEHAWGLCPHGPPTAAPPPWGMQG